MDQNPQTHQNSGGAEESSLDYFSLSSSSSGAVSEPGYHHQNKMSNTTSVVHHNFPKRLSSLSPLLSSLGINITSGDGGTSLGSNNDTSTFLNTSTSGNHNNAETDFESESSIEELYCHHFGITYSSDALQSHGGGSGHNDGFANSNAPDGTHSLTDAISYLGVSNSSINSNNSTGVGDIDGLASLGGLDLSQLSGVSNEKNFGNVSGCPRDWDKVLCWPDTPLGHTATLPCFSEFRAIMYDTSCKLQNIFPLCICNNGGKKES
jgi:hypothetical protein